MERQINAQTNYFIFNNRSKLRRINCFSCVSTVSMNHQSNCITYTMLLKNRKFKSCYQYAYHGELFITNLITFVLSRFRTSLLSVNQLLMREKTKFDIDQNSSEFLLQIKILVSSRNIMNSDKYLRWRRIIFVYYKEQWPKVDLWDSMFSIPQFEKIF